MKAAPSPVTSLFAERLFLHLISLLAGGAAIHGVQGSSGSAQIQGVGPSGGLPSVLAAEVAAYRWVRQLPGPIGPGNRYWDLLFTGTICQNTVLYCIYVFGLIPSPHPPFRVATVLESLLRHVPGLSALLADRHYEAVLHLIRWEQVEDDSSDPVNQASTTDSSL